MWLIYGKIEFFLINATVNHINKFQNFLHVFSITTYCPISISQNVMTFLKVSFVFSFYMVQKKQYMTIHMMLIIDLKSFSLLVL